MHAGLFGTFCNFKRERQNDLFPFEKQNVPNKPACTFIWHIRVIKHYDGNSTLPNSCVLFLLSWIISSYWNVYMYKKLDCYFIMSSTLLCCVHSLGFIIHHCTAIAIFFSISPCLWLILNVVVKISTRRSSYCCSSV